MGYREAEEYLFDLGIDVMKSMKPSLHRIEALCEVLDHPERTVPAIHLTGTNGKTSTARITSSLLTASGLAVGTYTSPHLESIRERLALDGEPISEEAFGDVFDHIFPILQLVEKKLAEKLSFFELLTAMFFLWTAEAGLDVAVVEVGLGGRWDATNVIDAPVSVITNIGVDHTKLMGSDRASIAREKAGIVKPASTLVSAERDPRIIGVIEEEISEFEVTASFLNREWDLLENKVALGGRYFSMKSSVTSYDGLFVPLHGAHQGVNAGTAIEAVTRFLPARTLDDELILEGLAATKVPGRIETLKRADKATVVLDVAHNPDGLSALISALIEEFAFDTVHFVMGILGDKDYKGMLAELSRVPAMLYVTEPKGVVPVPAAELRKAAATAGVDAVTLEDPFDAVERALDSAEPGDLVCITGSHYIVGEVRSRVLKALAN